MMAKGNASIILPHGFDDLRHGVDLLATETDSEARDSIIRRILSDISPLVASGATAALEFDRILKSPHVPQRDIERAFIDLTVDCAEFVGRHNHRIEYVGAARKKAGKTKSSKRQHTLKTLQQRYDVFWGVILTVLGQDQPPHHYKKYLDYLWDDQPLGHLSDQNRKELHAKVQPVRMALTDIPRAIQVAIEPVSNNTSQHARPLVATLVLETCTNRRK